MTDTVTTVPTTTTASTPTVVPYVREITGPATEPVTLAEARLWCRIDDDDETQDAMLLLIIAAARERVEDLTGMAFLRRTLELRLDAFPTNGAPIVLPFPPIASVQYVTYSTDGGDVSEVGSPEAFAVDAATGRLAPLAGGTWPTTSVGPSAVRIGYTAGYASVSAMPKRVRLWMQARVSTMYEFREHLIQGNIAEVPRDFVDGLLDGLRERRMFA